MIDPTTTRSQFPFITEGIDIKARVTRNGRLFADSTASTQLPLPVLERLAQAVFHYANVHRGAYNASELTTEDFERTYNAAANLVNANSWREIILGRNTTEMINLVMRGTASSVRDGDNVVLTKLEHNSAYVPWYALSKSMEKAGKTLEVRVANFDPDSGELDMDDIAGMIDRRTKLVGVTGASNFMGTKPDVQRIARLAHKSGYTQPDGSKGSYMLVDGAQLVPGCPVDVQDLDCDFLAWSFHKMTLPLGVGALYGKLRVLEQLDPFLFGGDMVDVVREGDVTYKPLPWRFTAGTPNILGTIATGYGISYLMNLALNRVTNGRADAETVGKQIETEILMNTPRGDFDVRYTVPEALQPQFREYLNAHPDVERLLRNPDERLRTVQRYVATAMNNIMQYEHALTQRAIDGLSALDEVVIYGPTDAERRAGLVAFNIEGMEPATVARELSARDMEVRHGPHCASLAHERMGIDGSVRMSFYLYNTIEDVDRLVEAVDEISGGDR